MRRRHTVGPPVTRQLAGQWEATSITGNTPDMIGQTS